ncbi:phosphatase PAP2 family protein [Candidatus Woesearchaeota archaeon]|nr:phosphatase PAP2 family protein [Candidatus Woesearchaeota archaeon]
MIKNLRIFKEWIKDITSFGSLPFHSMIFLVFILFGKYLTAFKIFLCIVISIGLVFLIRLFYKKDRPIKIKKNNTFLERLDSQSFPSAHSTRTASVFFIIGITIKELSLFLIILLILISLSRIILKKHYFTDISAGILIGILIGLFINYIL